MSNFFGHQLFAEKIHSCCCDLVSQGPNKPRDAHSSGSPSLTKLLHDPFEAQTTRGVCDACVMRRNQRSTWRDGIRDPTVTVTVTVGKSRMLMISCQVSWPLNDMKWDISIIMYNCLNWN